MAKVIDGDNFDFASYMAGTEPIQKVRRASEYIDEVIEGLFSGAPEPGACMPWGKTHDVFRFRKGEVTLWIGINGHGKSLVTGQQVLSLMGQGERACIASFEMKPRKTMARMGRQWVGAAPQRDTSNTAAIASQRDVYRQFGEWTDDKLWLYDQQGSVKPETVLGVIRYCAVELNIGHVVVDSLMKCVRGEDDYNGQKDFVNELCALAADLDIHIHLVHHIKKLATEDQEPGKFDAKGSGSITDQVDNVLTVWRNKRKEKDQQAGKPVEAAEPDTLLICDKQRNGEWEGRVGLYFDRESNQFAAAFNSRPVSFASFPHRPWTGSPQVARAHAFAEGAPA